MLIATLPHGLSSLISFNNNLIHQRKNFNTSLKMVKNEEIVGDALAKVLPDYGKPWYKVPHLLQLNLILLVPLLSSAVAGYDGM